MCLYLNPDPGELLHQRHRVLGVLLLPLVCVPLLHHKLSMTLWGQLLEYLTEVFGHLRGITNYGTLFK